MFERFTYESRRVVLRAQEEARIRSADHIGTQHLLLAVIHEADRQGAKALASLGVERPSSPTLEDLIPDGWQPPNPAILFHREVKEALDRAIAGASELGHWKIEPIHLLLGLVRTERDNGGQLSREFGFDASRAESTILKLLASDVETGHPDFRTDSTLGSAED